MIILGDQRFIAASFDNEEEIERVVLENAEYIFGSDSFMLPKSLIRSADGSGTIPDGYAVDFGSRRWFIVEAELGCHSVWGHIAPQVSKQIVAAVQPTTKARLVDAMINRIRDDVALRARLDELGIPEIDISRRLTEIIESPPIVGIPIDRISTDLKEWAETLRVEVKLWEVRKLVNFDDPAIVLYEIPDNERPAFDTSRVSQGSRDVASYDVGLSDLLEAGLLQEGQRLSMPYGLRGGTRSIYHAEVADNGDLMAGGRRFAAPSYAALMFIQAAGSQRRTVNGCDMGERTDDVDATRPVWGDGAHLAIDLRNASFDSAVGGVEREERA